MLILVRNAGSSDARGRRCRRQAVWHKEAFGKYRQGTDYLARLRTRVCPDAIPTTLVALQRVGEAETCARAPAAPLPCRLAPA